MWRYFVVTGAEEASWLLLNSPPAPSGLCQAAQSARNHGSWSLPVRVWIWWSDGRRETSNGTLQTRQAQHSANRRLRKCGIKLEGRIEMFVTERLTRARDWTGWFQLSDVVMWLYWRFGYCDVTEWRVYSAFRKTQHIYASKVTSFGLFTGQHQTYTYKKLYNRQYNFDRDLSCT
jgi:hypothetical protein